MAFGDSLNVTLGVTGYTNPGKLILIYWQSMIYPPFPRWCKYMQNNNLKGLGPVMALAIAVMAPGTAAAAFSAYDEPIPGTDQSIALVPVHGANFLMGSPEDEPGRSAAEGPAHEVSVADFWMGQATRLG